MFVKHVKSNLKGGVEATLGEKTLIVGPNGRGKSAIVNAVELACGGSASDIVGRTLIKRESDLINLGTGGVLESEATFSTGEVATYRTVDNGKGGAKRAEFYCEVGVGFPVRDVRSALAGSADTVRSWLLGQAAGDVSRGDVTAWFSPEDIQVYDSIAVSAGSEISTLLTRIESGAKSMRAKKRQIQTEQGMLDRMGQTLGSEATDAEMAALQKAVEDARGVYNRAVLACQPSGGQDVEFWTQEARDRIESVSHVEAVLNEVKSHRPPEPDEATRQNIPILRALESAHRVHIDAGIPNCLVCLQSGAVDHAELLAEKQEILRSAEGWLRWAQEVEASKGAMDRATALAQEAIERVHQAKAALVEAEPYTGPTVEQAQAALDEAIDRQNGAKMARRQWATLRGQRDTIRQLRVEVNELESMLDAAKSAVGRLLKSAVKRFTEAVQSYLPPSDVFSMTLEDGGKEVCRLGFERDGKLHTALSGAEWARLNLAVACAASEDQQGLRVFTPEERAFDPETLRNVMEALSEAPGQVIITSPIKHKGRTPKGWTVIDLG